MTYFLTSSPCLRETNALNPANGLIEELQSALPNPCKALFICSDPDRHEETDVFSNAIRESFAASGFDFTSFRTLDRRNEALAAPLIKEAQLLILAGGHVPTQNRFFREIGLRGLLRGYDGVILGISAGTMNSADVVYAQPELEGEAISTDYQRFLPGLGLTETMVLPHYQMIRNDTLDGLRLFEDIAYPDSVGRKFYALVDGSYFLGRNGTEQLRGEAYLIQDGSMRQISRENETVLL